MTQKYFIPALLSEAIAATTQTPTAPTNEPVGKLRGENWNDFTAPAATSNDDQYFPR